jgi:hypothetical protein
MCSSGRILRYWQTNLSTSQTSLLAPTEGDYRSRENRKEKKGGRRRGEFFLLFFLRRTPKSNPSFDFLPPPLYRRIQRRDADGESDGVGGVGGQE